MVKGSVSRKSARQAMFAKKAGKYGPLPSKTDEKQDLVKRGVFAQAKNPFQNKETVYTSCQLDLG